MEKLISDTNKLMLTKSNLKHKVNKVVRHLLDMEHTLKSCLDNILNKKTFRQKFVEIANNNDAPLLRQVLRNIGPFTYNHYKWFVPMLRGFKVNDFTLFMQEH